jgi:hypothetical protein
LWYDYDDDDDENKAYDAYAPFSPLKLTKLNNNNNNKKEARHLLACGSRPQLGSSNNTMVGAATSAIAVASFRRVPEESDISVNIL